jgi:uncharacterized protein YndB with AHSA1/START domain
MSTTELSLHIAAPRAAVYAALIDPDAIPKWRVPPEMTCEVHVFEPRAGGRFRVSLTYDEPAQSGKTTAHTDTYGGSFLELVPGERVVELVEFETDDPAMQGEMHITTTLTDAAEGGTTLVAVHDGLPPGVRPEDNEEGWRESLAKLAALVEGC